MRKNVMAAVALVLAAVAAVGAPPAAAYNGPAVTPRPTVNGGAGPIVVGPGATTVTLGWNIDAWADLSFPPARRPTHAAFEVKFGSDFVSDTGLAAADRGALVDAGGNLFRNGARRLDLAAYGRGPGDYYIRIIAKRGGNEPQHDAARRSPAVQVTWRANVQVARELRIEPTFTTIQVPGGSARFAAILTGGPGLVDWSVEGGSVYGAIVPDAGDPKQATLYAPAALPAGTQRIRVNARVRGEAGVGWTAEARVLRLLPGGAPAGGAVAPAPTQPVSVSDWVEVAGMSVHPAQPVAGQPYRVWIGIRNKAPGTRTGLRWRLLLDGGNVIADQTFDLPAGETRIAMADVTGNATLGSGTRYFCAQIDPENALGESAAARENNIRDLWVNVAPAAQETRDLDFKSAHRWGGSRLRHNFDNPVAGGPALPFAPPGVTGAVQDQWLDTNDLEFFLDCRGAGRARATPEALIGLELKHGWHVKEVHTRLERQGSLFTGGGSTIEWQVVPEAGATRPYMRVRLTCDPDHAIWAHVRIEIEGPAGTDPYRD